MGEIKTALEIALEKTAKINSDRSSIVQYEAQQQGKKLANTFLTGDIDLNAELKKAAGNDKKLLDNLKQGIFEVLTTQITLPESKDDLNKIDKYSKGFSAVIKNKEAAVLLNQLKQIFTQYIEETEQYQKMAQQQYAPKLRQKEEELSRRFGREIKVDPLQDPEFVNFLNQHLNALKKNYEPVAEQAKSELTAMFSEN